MEVVIMEDKNIGMTFKCISNKIKRTIDKKLDNNITNIQMFILGYIVKYQDERDIFQKDIENVLEVRRSTTTEILNTMERNDLIKRSFSANDKRQRIIVLSSKGQSYVDKFRETVSIIEKDLLEGITEEEQDVFFRVIEKLKNNLNNM